MYIDYNKTYSKSIIQIKELTRWKTLCTKQILNTTLTIINTWKMWRTQTWEETWPFELSETIIGDIMQVVKHNFRILDYLYILIIQNA